ncbi:MAG: hypothetical protein J2P34_08625 [Actinobacteria bacterium]|nr:hypothetical protein [Actinomycetota bacterium]
MLLADPTDQLDGLLERLRGPDAGFIAGLVDAAALDRPVLVEAGPAAAAVRPYTWLLARVGETGIALTSAGYLPPAVVTEAVTELGWERDWIGAANREHLTLPVLELRHSARRMALVRTHRGVLLRTAAGARVARDPVRLWWHLADRLPDGRNDAERDAGLVLLLGVASKLPHSSRTAGDLLRRGMSALGWHEARSRLPLDEWQAFEAARSTWEVLQRLGVFRETTAGEAPVPPGPAGVALARAALRLSLTRPVPAERAADGYGPAGL